MVQVLVFDVLCFCSLSEVGKDVQQFDYGVESMPHPVRLFNIKKKEGFAKSPGHLWRPDGASINMQSTISCIKMFRKHSPHPAESVSSKQHVLYLPDVCKNLCLCYINA